VPCRRQSLVHIPFILAVAGALATIMASAPYLAAAQGRAGPASLRQLTQEADAVVRARVTLATATLEAGGRVYPVVHADVLGTLKGGAAPGALVFANVGPGAASFTDGEEVLLFLQYLERTAELAATPLRDRLRYAGIPNAGEKIVLTDDVRTAFSDAVRGYTALDTLPDPETRGDALRKLTLEILTSGHPLLVTSTMRDFAPGGDVAALRLADLPAMVPLIESPRVPIGTRIALVAELERRGLIFGPARWVRLLRTSQGSDLLAAIRAVGEHPSAGVAAYLVRLLTQPDLEIATAAATALGVPGNLEAVHPLAASLGRDDAALRLAALHSLARIGTQGARQALELVAAKHPDVVLRQRAEIEAVVLARRQGTTLAPTLGFWASDPALTAPPAAAGTAVGPDTP
jgi:hypothetical protein